MCFLNKKKINYKNVFITDKCHNKTLHKKGKTKNRFYKVYRLGKSDDICLRKMLAEVTEEEVYFVHLLATLIMVNSFSHFNSLSSSILMLHFIPTFNVT